MGWTAAGLYRQMMYVQYSEQHEFELCMPLSQVNIVEMQSSRGEAFSFLVRHLPPKIWMPDTREYTCHPGYLQVTVPQTKTFKKHLTKTENKKGHWITSQTGWLGASASDHNPSNFSICYVPCNNTHCSSAGLKVNPFPVISCATSPELCNLLLCWGSCDSPTHIAASQGHRSLQLEKSPHIPAIPQQCLSHCNGSSDWLIAFAGIYRLIRAARMNRYLCTWPLG